MNISITHDNRGTRVIASLDAEKAFDLVEWSYLWEVLHRFGFGPKFIHCIQLLYQAPRARVRTNSWLSEPFTLFRGTRQGCPLSPGLFALTLEPLAILIRCAPDVLGLRLGKLEERLSLYADDALLYLNDAGPSLLAALCIFDTFGRYSGIKINWAKSILFPLDEGAIHGAASTPLRWVEEFCYLGVMITKHHSDYMEKNLLPALATLKSKCSTWASLPLYLLGRINLLKMVILPKFYYLFRNCPIWIPANFFKEINKCIGSFIWSGALPRLAHSTLWLPAHLGGLALPSFQVYYYWAAVLVMVQWWYQGSRTNAAICLEANCLGSLAGLRSFPYRGPGAYEMTPGPTRVL